MKKTIAEYWEVMRPDSVDFLWMMISFLCAVALCSFVFIEILEDAVTAFDAQYICAPRS